MRASGVVDEVCGVVEAEKRRVFSRSVGSAEGRKVESASVLLHNLEFSMGIIDTLRGTPSSVAKILAKSDDDGTSNSPQKLPLLFYGAGTDAMNTHSRRYACCSIPDVQGQEGRLQGEF